MFKVGACKGCKERRVMLQNAAARVKQTMQKVASPKGKK